MNRILFLVLLFAIPVLARAQECRIHAFDPAYANASYRICFPGNPFLDRPQWKESEHFDSNGTLSLKIPLEKAGMVRIRMGVYDASLYLEPGKEYRVELPPRREVGYQELLSPYFEYKEIPLKVTGDPGDLNSALYSLDSLFAPMNDLILYSRQQGLGISADSLAEALKEKFASIESRWFRAQLQYKCGMLKINEGTTGLEEIGRNCLGPRVWETHPGYMELSGVMFRDFLVYYGRTPGGTDIRKHINRTQNLDSLRTVLLSHPAIWNDTLADLVLLQELPSMFYRSAYHKDAILILLDSMTANPVKPTYAGYAREIHEKLASLVVGNPPPDFSLEDLDGESWSPDDFKGKYVYLMFCTPDHYGCMMEYPFLNSYTMKHKRYLEVLTVMVNEDESKLKDFMVRNDYLWKALSYGGKTEVLEDYQVRAFPMAYLIGPDGKLILSPSSLPSEGFEQQLFRIMRSRGDI